MAEEVRGTEDGVESSGSRQRILVNPKMIYIPVGSLIAVIAIAIGAIATGYDFKDWVTQRIAENRKVTTDGLGALQNVLDRQVFISERMANDIGEMKTSLRGEGARVTDMSRDLDRLQIWKDQAERRLTKVEELLEKK